MVEYFIKTFKKSMTLCIMFPYLQAIFTVSGKSRPAIHYILLPHSTHSYIAIGFNFWKQGKCRLMPIYGLFFVSIKIDFELRTNKQKILYKSLLKLHP